MSFGGEFMDAQQVVALRIRQLCLQKGFTPNGIAIHSAVPQGTLKSILNGESKNPGITTIKKLCDGFGDNVGGIF